MIHPVHLSGTRISDFSFMDIQRRFVPPYLIAADDDLKQEWSPQVLAYPPENFPFFL